MAYDFQGLVNDVLLELNEPELSSEAAFNNAVGFHKFAKNAVNWSINYINKEEDWEWPFNFVNGTIVCVAGQGGINNPYTPDPIVYDWDSFYVAYNGALTTGKENRNLTPIDMSEYKSSYMDRDINGNNATPPAGRGKPRYIVRNTTNDIIVTPIPDQAYNISYRWLDTQTSLSLYTDVSAIPAQFRDVVVKGALVRCYAFRGDENMYKLYLEEFKDDINAMRRILIVQEDTLKAS